ncbi:MAG: hypothetical protein VX874_18400 [Pseudomonadota bacterium]|nr:hypothetical protein [Pseudomonadota bacterium]
MSISVPHIATAKGSWTCGYEDIAGIERADEVREATLSQKFYVTDDGRVEVVRIVVEDQRPPFWIALVHGVREKLGLRPDERVAKALTRDEKKPQPQINTELHNWSLSPLKRVRLDVPDC